jgi:hypothetical protein
MPYVSLFKDIVPIQAMMVPQEGLEPPTLTLEPSCSIQLSYWGMEQIIADVKWYPHS